jgi:hypothetical protein
MRFLWMGAALSMLLITAKAGAQQPPSPAPFDFADARPTNCEDRTARVDGINQSVSPGELIIVVARPGAGETRADLGRRRLYNVRAYWTKFLPAEMRRKPETIIPSEGERVAGSGRLEFYTCGKLSNAIKFRRNEHLLVGECYPPDDSYIRNGKFNLCEVKSNQIFYPCLNEKARRGRAR